MAKRRYLFSQNILNGLPLRNYINGYFQVISPIKIMCIKIDSQQH